MAGDQLDNLFKKWGFGGISDRLRCFMNKHCTPPPESHDGSEDVEDGKSNKTVDSSAKSKRSAS